MKRFWIFEIPHYHPSGGMEDFKESFDLIEEAILFCEQEIDLLYSSYHIYDSLSQNVVKLSTGYDKWSNGKIVTDLDNKQN